MIDVFFITTPGQVACDRCRIGCREGETLAETRARAIKAVRRAGGARARFCYMGR